MGDPFDIPLWARVHEGAVKYGEISEEPHVVPSASQTSACIRQQVYNGRRVPRTNPTPVRSQKNMAQGALMEDYWFEVYEQAGFQVQRHPPAHPLTDDLAVIPGSCDGILDGDTVLELKNLGAWSYISFIQKGLKEAEVSYYYQVQAYMHAYGMSKAILHAGVADPSGTVWIWQRIKKQEGRMPDFWLEEIPFDYLAYEQASRWAKDVDFYANKNPDIPMAQVPRTWHEGQLVDPAGMLANNKFPCAYCGWAQACIKDGTASLLGGGAR